MGKLFIKLKNNYMLCVLLVSPLVLLMLVKKYLIKLWICGNGELISNLEWETDQKVESLVLEVSKSLPINMRATIEERC